VRDPPRNAIAAGKEEAAADAFSEALAAARSDGRAGHLAPVLTDYGTWLVESGRADEAEPLLDEPQALSGQIGAKRWLDHIATVRPRAEVGF
jgi:hypothetical protein